MRASFGWTALVLVLASLAQSPAMALSIGEQVPPKKDKLVGNNVTWTVESPEIEAAPGDTVNVRIKGEVPEKWHTYSLKVNTDKFAPKTTLQLLANDLAEISGAVTYDPQPSVDAELTTVYKENIEIFEHKFVVIVPVKISAKATFPLALKFKINSRICDQKFCKPDSDFELPVTIKKKEKPQARLKPLSKTPEVQWTIPDSELRINAKSNDIVMLHPKAMIQSEWHIYTSEKQGDYIPMTAFKVLSPESALTEQSCVLGQVEGPIAYDREAITHYDETLKQEVKYFEEAVTFTVPVRIGSCAKGDNVLTIKIAGQACRVGLCKTMSAEFDITMIAPESATLVPDSFTAPNPRSGILKEGLGAFLWAAVIGGLASLLTPCVFPMIPITVSFFTKRKHISHAHAVGDAFIFSTGIVATYVIVGIMLALVLGRDARDLANNPYVNLGIFALFMVMAFSLLGFYELQLPTGIINKLNASAHGGQSKFGLMLMGLVFTLTSFSCTGPFVGSVMAAALKGDWLWPMLGMTVFATVFALPFFFLAIFPSMLKSLPKSGSWMNSVKVVMGLVEIAAAMKFLSSADLVWHWGLLTRPVFIGIWLALSLLTVVYLLGWIRFPHDSKVKKRSVLRLGFCALFVASGAFLVADLAGHKEALGPLSVYPPPALYPPGNTEVWESGLALARKECKPVFFDFTGINCVNCRKMEESVFPRTDVAALMKNFVVVRLYTDGGEPTEFKKRSEENMQTLLQKYNVSAVPYYAVVSPDGTKISEFDDGYTTDIEKFKGFLTRASSSKVTGCDLASTHPEPSTATAGDDASR